MRHETDLAAVKSLARALLMLEPEGTAFSPMVVKHPFTDSGIVGIRKENGELGIGNIMEHPEDLISWRGVRSRRPGNVEALSWTLNKKTAEWFAHRFGRDGTVYEAQIDRDQILAVFNSRNEAEVIVDPNYLRDVTPVQTMRHTQEMIGG